MFCPNCGTQNPETAQTCSKCNFHVKGAAAPKFKGTMLMMNQPAMPPAAAPPPAQPPPQAPPQAQQGAPSPAFAPQGAPPNRLKGTMVGVAPMALPGMGAPSPVAVPAAGGAMSPPRTPAPPAFAAAPEAPSAFSPPVPQAGVNPLGGTVAADTFAPPQGFPPYGGSQPAAPSPQYGAPSASGVAQPVAYGAYGAPAQPGLAPPPGQQGPGMAHAASRPTSPGGGPTRRNEVTTWLVPGGLVFGGVILGVALAIVLASTIPLLGGLLLTMFGVGWWTVTAIQMANEIKSVTRDESFAWWPLLVPVYRQYWMWFVVPAEITRAKQALGVRQPDRPVVLYVLMWHFAVASDLNEMVK